MEERGLEDLFKIKLCFKAWSIYGLQILTLLVYLLQLNGTRYSKSVCWVVLAGWD